MSKFFEVKTKHKKNRARTGVVSTAHGKINTPAFIAVGSQATVKALSPDDLKVVGIQTAICNTYHLYLRPGDEIVKKQGGLHKFMGWDAPLITDSGGFQAFSLGKGIEEGISKIASSKRNKQELKKTKPGLVKIREEGVIFRSHLDGSRHLLTPEKSVQIQKNLGADINFVLDECTSPSDDYKYTKKAMERTHRWEERSRIAFNVRPSTINPKQFLFGIVQGGAWKSLREESARFVASLPFAGYGIGGSLGKPKKAMYQVLDWSIPFLPEDKPRHFLGIGEPEDILGSVEKGVDLFDCVMPTRLGRKGTVLTRQGKINITKTKFLGVKTPIEKNCACPTCRNFPLGYITHLFRANELLAYRLATMHNLYFMTQFFQEVRSAIESGRLDNFKRKFLNDFLKSREKK